MTCSLLVWGFGSPRPAGDLAVSSCPGWDVTRIGVKDALLDAQTLRTAGSAPYGGADIGACLAAAAQVRGTDLTSWHDAWASTAARVLARTAGVMLMGAPLDPRLVESSAAQADAFRRGAALLTVPPGPLEALRLGRTAAWRAPGPPTVA